MCYHVNPRALCHCGSIIIGIIGTFGGIAYNNYSQKNGHNRLMPRTNETENTRQDLAVMSKWISNARGLP